MAVPYRVPKRFLRNPKERQSHLLVGRLDFPLSGERDLHVVLPLHFGAVRLQGGDKTNMVQDARVETVRQEANAFRQVLRPSLPTRCRR